jgi:hypothetical protein
MKYFKTQVDAMGFVIFAILAVVGTIIISKFDSSAGSIASTTAGRAAINNITANTYGGIGVISIGPVIFAAVVILAIVGLLMGKR